MVADTGSQTLPEDGRIFAHRFRTERLLKTGQGVATFLGIDLVEGERVIIKTVGLSHVAAVARMRLEHEAEVLRRLRSPRLTPLVAVGRHGELLWMVAPFVPGVTLAQRLASGPLPVAEALAVGRGILEALGEAHDQGVIHRDVKPSNVIVDEDGPTERATLIDFGLARSVHLDASVRDIPVGTVRYLSPEAAGLINAEADERSDLYSVGAVLFECLAGRPPYEGTTLGEVLQQHLSSAVPGLRSLGVRIPRALDEAVQRLLAKDPNDRYQSAGGALADLGDIRDGMARGLTEPPVVVGLRDRRPSLAEPAFVGRDGEMVKLAKAFDRARRGRGGTVLLEAESGGGKTRLLEEFARRAVQDGAWVSWGRGLDQAAPRPFEVLAGVARELVAASRADPRFAETLRRRLHDKRDALCVAFPELAESLFPGVAETLRRAQEVLGPEKFGEMRTLDALVALLDTLGQPDRPALVLLDDCQWADEMTVKLLVRWQRQRQKGNASPVPVLVVVSFRSEEVPADHPLRGLETSSGIVVAPLAPRDAASLVESMAGPLPDEVVGLVVKLCDGSPFMASAVLRGLVECRALIPEASTWRVDPEVLAEASASRQAGVFLARRLALLSADSLALLSVGAVLGKEFDLELAAELAGLQPNDVVPALDTARQRHMVWEHSGRCTFVHDKIREAVLEQLGGEARQALHRRAAERIEATDPERIFELAYHFDAAGESERALPYALAAAEQARARHALAQSQQFYAIAARGAGEADPATRARIQEGLGDVLMLRGRYEEAAAPFEAAAALVEGAVARARLEGKLGELAFKRGDNPAAGKALEAGLRLLGRRVPRRSVGFVFACAREVVVQVLHTVLPHLFLARRSLTGAEAELVAVRLYSRLAHVYWFQRGAVPTLWAHLREMNLAERYPATSELAQAYSEHAPVMTMIPMFQRGVAYAERSLAIRRDLGNVWGQGQSLHFLGLVLYGASRFTESLEKCQEAVRLLERTGDHWEMNTASWHIAFACYRLGDLAGAVELARRVHQAGVEIGDPQARGISLGVWAKASGGHVPAELVTAELERRSDDVHTGAEVLQAEAVRLLGAGCPSAATRVLREADRLVRRAGLRQEYVAPILPWLATALRSWVEECPAVTPGRRRVLVRRARLVAWRARRRARCYRNNLPHALRESGLIAAVAGHPRRARRWLDQGLAVAEAQGMRQERASTLLARGRLGVALGWPGSQLVLETAQGELCALEDQGTGRPVTLSLVDRFDAVLEEGRRIASTLGREEVYRAVQAAATRLLRGERCLVVELRQGMVLEELRTAGGEPGERFSRAVVGRTLEAGKPVVLLEEAGSASESMALEGIRCALGAPVFARGQAVACLYVEHRAVAGLFGEEETRLAAFLTTVAGAALETTEGFAEIQALTRSLEQRVADRTVELTEANRRLSSLDELKNEFMGMVAHDLRSPLTVVDGFVGMLQQRWGQLSETEARKSVEIIFRNTQRLSQLVENLLQFARIESGDFGYHIRPFDLGVLVRRTVGDLAASSPEVRFSLQVPDALPTALGDEQRQWQMLTNLVSNAMKFSPSESPIDVGVSVAGEMLRVTVRDRGPGIRAEDQARIFEKFKRGVSAEGTRIPGTGLGLYITRSLTEAQGGRIAVESTPGRGATFSYTVPIARGLPVPHAVSVPERLTEEEASCTSEC